MTPESHGDEVASTTQLVHGRGPEPKQIGDLLLREHVGSFERAVAPRPFGCFCPAASHPVSRSCSRPSARGARRKAPASEKPGRGRTPGNGR